MGLVSRIRNAGSVLFGKEDRAPTPFTIGARASGIRAPFKPRESLKAYGDNPYLYSAITRIASELSRVKINLYTEKASGEKTLIKTHQALETLKKPQKTSGGKSILTGMNLKFLTGQHLGLNGEGFWLLDDRSTIGGAPKSIYPLLPANVELEQEEGEILRYRYRMPHKELIIDPMDMVHFKLTSPENWYRGHSPTQSIRYALDTNQEADVMNVARLRNNAVPNGYLKTEQKVDAEDRKRLLDQWRQAYGGSGNSGKLAFMPSGVEYQSVQQSNSEMQYIEGKLTNRDEILANLGVGMEILGQTESQTRANAETAVFVFMRFGILPIVDNFIDTLNNDYLPAFPGTEKMFFEAEDVVPENVEEKRANIQTLMGASALTPDEARAMLGLEPLKIKGVTDVPQTPIMSMPAFDSAA